MNREIKFRAWNPYDRTMYQPTKDEDALFRTSYELAVWDGGWEMCAITAAGKQVVVAHRTRNGETGGVLMQYTGLRDKNGVEIYEGDIVEWPASGSREQVVFASGMFVFKPTAHAVMNYLAYIEVIGNIYANPELLESVS